MLKPKYQVFISSTYNDLKEERRAAIDAVLKLEHIPVGMEAFRADDSQQKEIIQRWLEEVDIYILILGARYGTIDKETNISYTEWEYNLAEKLGIPRLVFVLDDTYIRAKAYDYKDIEIALPQYKSFKERLEQKYVHKVSNLDELTSEIGFNLEYIIDKNRDSLKGWIDGKYAGLIESIEAQDSPYQNIIQNWGLRYIFPSRAEKNRDSDPKLKDMSIKQLDGIAFGLKNFRSFHTEDIENCLLNGMKIRFLVMDPKGNFVKQREAEEKEVEGQISQSIQQLVEWAERLKKKTGGDISIKYYNSMTLDFYWRLGDCLYVGPYLYGKTSQSTLTYKYIKGSQGFDMYTRYFEDLWNDDSLTREVL